MGFEAQLIGAIKKEMAKVAEGNIRAAPGIAADHARGQYAGLDTALKIINNLLEGERDS